MIKYLIFYIILIPFINAYYLYYKLDLQKWCTDNYMIHGLWPQISPNEYPTYCYNDSYIEPKGKLKNQMNLYWSSCNNTDLWEHEWLKHGTCVKKQYGINENTYFNTAIQLFIDYKNLLNKCNNNMENCTLGCFDLDFNLINCP